MEDFYCIENKIVLFSLISVISEEDADLGGQTLEEAGCLDCLIPMLHETVCTLIYFVYLKLYCILCLYYT